LCISYAAGKLTLVLLGLLAVLVLDPLQAMASSFLHLLNASRRRGLRLLHAFLQVAAAAVALLRGRARFAVVPLIRPRHPERAAPLHSEGTESKMTACFPSLLLGSICSLSIYI
ncbi:unnamed protein product, partial [Musa banksii]